jgi:succinate-semialdehyde dehydrogenase / glutarate-semialdehyde dehydrogenase
MRGFLLIGGPRAHVDGHGVGTSRAAAAEYLEWCGEEAVHVAGTSSNAPDGSARVVTRRRPVGPCLIITPWNVPLVVPARGVGAALAAGCTVVLRSSALTPLSAHALAGVLEDSDLPVGVLNVIVSSENGTTDGLLADRLRKLTFTGSTDVGRHLIAKAADRVLRVSVELGGQAPFIVLADADLDAAVDGAVEAKMRNGAEAGTAANRFYVDRAIADEFTHRLAKRLGALRIGRGADVSVDLGPMIGDRQRARLQGLVTDAVARGARIALEGGSLPGVGHLFAPVVLVDVPDDARVMRQEIFGPIAPVIPVDGEADGVARANRCDQGLAGYVDTRDLDAALRVSDALEVGMVPSTGGASPRLPRRLAARRSRDTGPLETRARWRTPDTHVVSIGRPGT